VKHKAQESTRIKKSCASRWIHKQACTRNIYAHWIRAIHKITTLQHSTSTCRGRSCLKNKQTKRAKRTKLTRASIQLFRLRAQWQNSSMLEIGMNIRREIHHRSILLIGISTCAGRGCYKKKQKKHHSGTRAGQHILLPEGPTRRNISCSATTITNDAQCIHHFCSRDQLTDARNAITCALTSFVLTSIVIRHAARETTRGWRNLLKRPLADDVPCSRDHSQNVLATVRVVVLHTHVSVFLSLFLLELPLAEGVCFRNSQTAPVQRGACGRQYYDNDNSQYKPRDFGWKLRGARRISRE
jgi:hypothetical protein